MATYEIERTNLTRNGNFLYRVLRNGDSRDCALLSLKAAREYVKKAKFYNSLTPAQIAQIYG